MSDQITDTDGNPLLFVNLKIDEGADSNVVVARIPCKSGMKLASSNDGRASVLARRTGSGAAFVNLATSPISLDAYDGETVSFDFKVRAGSVTGLERVALPVRVTFNP